MSPGSDLGSEFGSEFGPDFGPDEAQRAVAQAAADVLDGAGTDLPERTWKALGQAGLLSLAVPAGSAGEGLAGEGLAGEGLGGEGLGVVETAMLLAEVGRRAAPVPALATLALGVLPVARWGTASQHRRWLSGVASGGVVLTAALREPSDPAPVVPATTAGPDRRITGTKVGVLHADRATAILVPVRLTGGGTAVALVEPAAPGVSLHRTFSASGAAEQTVRLDGVTASDWLGDSVTGDRAVVDLYRLAVAGACAVGAGAAAGALALTTAHIGSREQFGRPLATFQAVAQQIADVYLAARTIHLVSLAACWRLGANPPGAQHPGLDADLDTAAYWFTHEAPQALRTCHHLHGGLGLDVTYPLHRFSSLVKDLVRFLGGAAYTVDRLGSRDVH
jgi:3-oxo-4-pregnene-20-carboxyl-CoA dehydrogenase alpha subunit